MQISTINTAAQSLYLELLLLGAILFSLRKKIAAGLSLAVTEQIKGMAILAVIFSHIGYFLFTDHQFLFPLSVYAGVGVDAFLVFSGFGLTVSMLRRRQTPLAFYRKRLLKLYLPWWICLAVFVMLDFFLLHLSYSFTELWQAAVGFFPKANLYQNIDSPLWYFSFIVSYYILFPIVFWKKFPSLSALVLYGVYAFVVPNYLPGSIDWGVRSLYSYHIMAFPLGMVLAHAASYQPLWNALRGSVTAVTNTISFNVRFGLRLFVGAILIGVLYYVGIHSWVGRGVSVEQYGSLLTVALLLLTVVVLPVESRVLQWVGQYSYELYLIHWPLLYRYGYLYQYLPAWLATALLLLVCFGLAVIVQKSLEAMTKGVPQSIPATVGDAQKAGVVLP